MKLSFDEATEAFRAEFSDWLDENLPDPSETTERPRSTSHVPEWSRLWQAKMFDAGWLLPGNLAISARSSERPLLARWSGPGYTDHLIRHDNVSGGVSCREGSVTARSSSDKR